jgi:hypothetical protein
MKINGEVRLIAKIITVIDDMKRSFLGDDRLFFTVLLLHRSKSFIANKCFKKRYTDTRGVTFSSQKLEMISKYLESS